MPLMKIEICGYRCPQNWHPLYGIKVRFLASFKILVPYLLYRSRLAQKNVLYIHTFGSV